MAISAPAIMATAAVATTAYTVYSGEQAKSAQKEAARDAKAQAKAQAKKAEEEFNRVNQKRPNASAMYAANAAMAKGAGSTMLTGPGGSPAGQSLGGTSLLGS